VPDPASVTTVVTVDDAREQHESPGMTDGMAISFVDEDDCGFFGQEQLMCN
jgi:hypothetical protein